MLTTHGIPSPRIREGVTGGLKAGPGLSPRIRSSRGIGSRQAVRQAYGSDAATGSTCAVSNNSRHSTNDRIPDRISSDSSGHAINHTSSHNINGITNRIINIIATCITNNANAIRLHRIGRAGSGQFWQAAIEAIRPCPGGTGITIINNIKVNTITIIAIR